MDYTQIAKEVGCLDTATEDVTRRLEARFQDETPSPEAVKEWIRGTLAAAAPHLFPPVQTVWERLKMTEEAFNKMPVAWRLQQGYQDPAHVVEDRQARRLAAQREREAAQQPKG